MESDVKFQRYAHEDGHTAVCYSSDGKYVYTCGNDCEVRTWSLKNDDQLSSLIIRDPGTTILSINNKIFVGCGNYVESYEYPSWREIKKYLRFSAPVTDMDVSKDGDFIAAGSCDMKVKLIDVNKDKLMEFSGHTAPVLQVAMDPDIKYLASSSGDGSVKVWDIASGECIQTFKNVIEKSNDFYTAKCLGRPTWLKLKNTSLALAKGDKVCIYSSQDWKMIFELTYSKLMKDITLVSVSYCGEYLCGATTVGELVFWNLKTQKVVSYEEAPCPNKVCISSLKWSPVEREITFCDRMGRLCIFQPKLDGECLGEDDVKEDVFESMSLDGERVESVKDRSEDDENAISLSDIKASSGFLPNGEMNEDVSGEESDYEYPQKKEPKAKMDLQRCFQPSATPSHFQHGYMVWNSVGIVRNFNSDAESSIDVEFHNTMFHHSFHRRNPDEYHLADLNEQILCLASTSKLSGYHLNSWAEVKEWSLDMPDDETILALAASGNWICCATDLNQLRIYSITGIQRQIISLPGPIVCMAGYDRLLIAVFHLGLGLPGYQNLGYYIYEVSEFLVKAVTPCQPLPLTPKSKLKWLGFSDEGTPCTYDSSGILRLSRDFLHWQVLCNIREHCSNKSDNYFLIGVNERLQAARCILCKGSWYPMTAPRPTVVEKPLKIPLCDPEAVGTMQEDSFWRHVFSYPVMRQLALDNDSYAEDYRLWETDMKQTLIKMFRDAYRNNAEMKAVDLASLMTEQILEKAFLIVHHGGRSRLGERLEKIVAKDWDVLSSGRVESILPHYSNALMQSEADQGYTHEIRNTYGNHAQGDMFEDFQTVQSGHSSILSSIETRDNEKNSQENTSQPRTTNINPFKVQKKNYQGPKGLDFFNTVEKTKLKPAKPDQTNQEKVQIKPKQVKQKSGQKKMNFVQWFNYNKSSLQADHPDLSNNELTKIAMKLFREEKLTAENSKPNENTENFEEPSPGAKKRKLDDDDDDNSSGGGQSETKQSVADKLSAFSFIK